MSKVVVLFTGGTIASQFDPSSRGHRAVLTGAEVLALAGGLAEIAEVEAIDWGRVPASQFTFAHLLEIAHQLDQALARDDVDGAVMVQGTDSIEEMSYGLDLLLGSAKPVVVVGAMRSPDQPGFDGAANLRDAVRCAADPALRDQGVVVVMAGEIHGADDVTKTHTESYTTFKSLNLGPMGHVHGDQVVMRRARTHRPRIATDVAGEPVYLVVSVIGSDGSLIRAARAMGARGFVIAGAGTGNTPVDLLAACLEVLADDIPVVLCTRCPSGRVTTDYAFPGAGARWQEAGAVLAGTVGGPKSRIALALGIGAGLSRGQLQEVFPR